MIMLTWSIWLDNGICWDENVASLFNIGIRNSDIENITISEWITLAVL